MKVLQTNLREYRKYDNSENTYIMVKVIMMKQKYKKVNMKGSNKGNKTKHMQNETNKTLQLYTHIQTAKCTYIHTCIQVHIQI